MPAGVALGFTSTRRLRAAAPAMFTVLAFLASATATARADQPLWQQPVPVDRNPPFTASEPLTAISCPSASACLAFGIGGQILSSTDPAQALGSWSTTTLDAEHGSVQAASCPSTSLCVAVDGTGDVITSTDPFAPEPRWKVVKIDHASDGTLWSISCPTVSLCVTTDVQGDVLSSTEPTGGAGAWHTARVQGALPGRPPSGGLLGISCPTAKFCAAVDRLGEVFTTTAVTHSAPTNPPALAPGRAS